MSVVKTLLCSLLISFSNSLMAADATETKKLQLYFGDFLDLGNITNNSLTSMLSFSSTFFALKLKDKNSSYAVLSLGRHDNQEQLKITLGPKTLTFKVNHVHSEYQLLLCRPVSVEWDEEIKEVDIEDTDKYLFFQGSNYLVTFPNSAIKDDDLIKINGVTYIAFTVDPT